MQDTSHKSHNQLRVIAGLLIAPVFPTLLIALPHLWMGHTIAGNLMKVAALVNYPTMLLLGYPSYLVLRRRGWTGMWTFVALGLALGVVAFLVALLSGLLVRNLGIHAIITTLPRAAIGGMLALGVFWAIARPDKA
jgi:hypothetical protein